MFEILTYQDREGRRPYTQWLVAAAAEYWNDWKRSNAK